MFNYGFLMFFFSVVETDDKNGIMFYVYVLLFVHKLSGRNTIEHWAGLPELCEYT